MTVLERPLAHLKFSNLIEGGGYNELKKNDRFCHIYMVYIIHLENKKRRPIDMQVIYCAEEFRVRIYLYKLL